MDYKEFIAQFDAEKAAGVHERQQAEKQARLEAAEDAYWEDLGNLVEESPPPGNRFGGRFGRAMKRLEEASRKEGGEC